jgi:hypothetical protein
VIAILGYNHFTVVHYGRGLFFEAVGFSSSFTRQHGASASAKVLDALVFVGGGSLGPALAGIIAARWRIRCAIALVFAAMVIAAKVLFETPGGWASAGPFDIQAGLLAAAGVAVGIMITQTHYS